jgi:hypothetical protein
LEHLVALNDVRVALAVSLPDAGGEILWWRSDWELRGRFREPVVPDALFMVRWQAEGEQAFSLEVDNVTHSQRRFLAKLLGYASRGPRTRGFYGLTEPVVLVVLRDAGWLERYRLVAQGSSLRFRIWFATLSDVGRRGATGEIWRSADGERSHSLRDLGTLPYGKEARAAEAGRTTRG